jgi:alanine racemase
MIHKTYNGPDVARICDAKLFSSAPDEIRIHDILIDSRRLISPEDCMFFALVTRRNDGHKYVDELYEKGVRHFTISRNLEELKKYKDANFFVVEDTLTALQRLAAWNREQYDIPVIGITGSNGKTIVKEWLFQLLSADRKIIRSPKSYNSQIGVPLSVWQINEDHEMAVIEAGISEPEEMQKLREIIKPTIGIFTNIGEAHSENFINNNQKIGEKLKLFTKVDVLIYNPDHKEIQDIVIRSEILNNIDSFCWGTTEECELRIKEKSNEEKQSIVRAEYHGKEVSIRIPFTDEASIENAIHCWAVMLYLGYPNDIISERIEALTPIAMRLELKAGVNNCTIINDSYNSDFNALSIALDFLNQQNQHRKKVLILSDILQSGRNEVDLYTDVAALLEQKGVDELIGIGPAIGRQKEKFGMKATFFEDTSAFLSAFPFANFTNQSILLKGARVFEFEQISRLLQQKVHETVLEINLDSLVYNMNYYRSLVDDNVKLMAMVKAFSYGSGGFEIANMLQYHHVDYLAVAYADEGIELRKAGIKLPIMVMNPEEYAFETMIKYQLEPEIFSFRALRLLERAIKRNAMPQNKPVKVHIKVDTGMNRLGFVPTEMDRLVEALKQNPLIYVQSVFSHLSASDKPEFDDFTREQIQLFREMGSKIASSFEQKVFLHILNSAGIHRFPEAAFDMVRLGIGMYGISPATEDAGKLKAVTTMRSEIAQIKQIKRGDSVSYNRSFVAREDMRIGVVSVGYADGLMRNLGNGKLSLIIKGKEATVVGDICMDMCMVDITNIEAREGDEVIIFNDEYPVTRISEAAETIPYEILSRISRRVKRVYYHE